MKLEARLMTLPRKALALGDRAEEGRVVAELPNTPLCWVELADGAAVLF